MAVVQQPPEPLEYSPDDCCPLKMPTKTINVVLIEFSTLGLGVSQPTNFQVHSWTVAVSGPNLRRMYPNRSGANEFGLVQFDCATSREGTPTTHFCVEFSV